MAEPIHASSRAKILDILRGIALFGVYFANLGAFTGYAYLNAKEKAQSPTAMADLCTEFFHFAFIDGKFYSIFSLLFGIGFAIIMSKRKGIQTFYKRIAILLAIGLSHAFLLWEGDILLLYALLGLLLPLFSRASNKSLLILSIFLILSPILLDTIRVVSDGGFAPEKYFLKKAVAIDKKTNTHLGTNYTLAVPKANYEEMRNFLVGGFFYRWSSLLESNRLPKVLALFLLGMMIGRNRWYENLEEKRPFLRRLRKWCFVLGFPMSILFAYLNIFYNGAPKVLEATVYALSVIPMALVYVTTFVLFYINNKTRLAFFGYVGKMTLTNYILQSCLAYLMFYGTGWALFGHLGAIFHPVIAIAVFSLQILLSKVWLTYFEFGPIEWVWRQLTYGKFIPLRKRKLDFNDNVGVDL